MRLTNVGVLDEQTVDSCESLGFRTLQVLCTIATLSLLATLLQSTLVTLLLLRQCYSRLLSHFASRGHTQKMSRCGSKRKVPLTLVRHVFFCRRRWLKTPTSTSMRMLLHLLSPPSSP